MSDLLGMINGIGIALLVTATIRYIGRKLGKPTSPGARWLCIRMD